MKNLLHLAIELFKVSNGPFPEIIEEFFVFQENET